jgi:hypothetical protein
MRKLSLLAAGVLGSVLVSGYIKFPLWRDYRIHTPFGGVLFVQDKSEVGEQVVLKSGIWESLENGHKLVVEGDRLIYRNDERILGILIVKDKYGEGVAKVTGINKFGSGAAEIWVLRE